MSEEGYNTLQKGMPTSIENSDDPYFNNTADGSLVGMTPDQRTAEIKRCKKMIQNYQYMNYAMAIYSGMFLMIIYPNLNHVKTVLNKSAAQYTSFDALTKFPWTIKPIFGWISDSFFPFRLRMKSYIFLMAVLHIFFCILIFSFPKANFQFFTICVFMVYFTVGFIDTLGEGMTAIITKMEMRLKKLEELEHTEEEGGEGRAIGFFFVFRTLIRTIAIWGGGLLSANKVGIGSVYIILAIFPCLLIVYLLFVFKEEKKKTVCTGCTKLVSDLSAFIKILVHPAMIFPLLLNLALFSIPTLGDAGNYILLNEGGWTVSDLSYLTLANGLVYSFAMIYFLRTALAKIKFRYNYFIGAFLGVVNNAIMYFFLYIRDLSFGTVFSIMFVQAIIGSVAGFLPQIATIGRFTAHLPEGFESTGVTILVSICNVGIISAGLLSAKELNDYDIKAGYYNRIVSPFHLNLALGIILVFLVPFCVNWKDSLKKRKETQTLPMQEKNIERRRTSQIMMQAH